MSSGYRLGIDYGTSNTVAVVSWPDARMQQLLFDGSPLLPSAVCLDPRGQLLVGSDAVYGGRLDAAGFEPNPKRRIDESEMLLGNQVVPVVDAIAATMRRVAAEAARVAGGSLDRLAITYPSAWGPTRRGVLTQAASRAGLPAPDLVPEPVSAAAYFGTVLGHQVQPNQLIVIYDLGAGTFDVSVVRRGPSGFDVLDVDGLADFGGLDLDAIVVGRLGAAVSATAPEPWQRLSAPGTAEDRRHFRTLWDDARTAKEMLSRHSSATLHVPLVGRDAVVSREEFERAAEPQLRRAAQLADAVMRRAGVTPQNLAGLFLVGGSSRVPLVATTVHRATGVAPVVLEQPEIVVAHGALLATAAAITPATAATITPATIPPPAVHPPRPQWTPIDPRAERFTAGGYGLEREERLSALGPTAPAGPSAAPSRFDVVLDDPGRRKISVIKIVRELTGLGLRQAKDLVDSAPQTVLQQLNREQAQQAAARLTKEGADVALKPSTRARFDVVLDDTGRRIIQVIKVVRELTGLGLRQAKDLVESAPQTVLRQVDRQQAERLIAQLKSAGASARQIPAAPPTG